MDSDEQLALWVNGESVHNDERDECCPDFSCCRPDLLARQEDREEFMEGGAIVRDGMLLGFLGALLAADGTNAYIAGDPATEHGEN